MKFVCALVANTALLFATPGWSQQSSPVLNGKVIVLDVSDSMSPRRPLVQRELLEAAAAESPTSTHPYIVLLFADSVSDPLIFRDRTEFETFVNQLRTGGGTRIAEGLRAAIELIQKAKRTNLRVYLYTDGEDNDPAIKSREMELAQLFADRLDKGLGDHVFVRRWGNSLGTIATEMKKHGLANVVDASGNALLLHATLDPQITVQGTPVRDADGLIVELQANLNVSASHAVPRGTAVKVKCEVPGASGDTTFNLLAGSVTNAKIRLPVNATQTNALSEVAFRIEPPKPMTIGTTAVVPSLARKHIAVNIPLPPIPRKSTITLAARQQGQTRMTDFDKLQSEADFEATIDCQCDMPGDFPEPVELTIQVVGATLAGDGRVTIPRPGAVTVPIKVHALGSLPKEISLTCTKQSSDSHEVTVSKAVLLQVTGPPKRTTSVDVAVKSVTPKGWVDLESGIAKWEADVHFDVQGALRNGRVLTVKSASGVTAFELSTNQLHTGLNRIAFQIQAYCKPRQEQTLDFEIAPEPDQWIDLVLDPNPLGISVTGPQSVQLMVRERMLTATLPEGGDEATIKLTPVLPDEFTREMLQKISVTATGSGGVEFNSAAMTLAQSTVVSVRAPSLTQSVAYFVDAYAYGEVLLSTRTDCVAIEPARVKVRLVRQAIFKRLLAIFFGIAFAIGIVVIPGYAAARTILRPLGRPVVSSGASSEQRTSGLKF